MSFTVHLPNRAVSLNLQGEASLMGPDDLPQAASASVVCATCAATTPLTGPAAFLTAWDDDLRVHELHFEATLRGPCAGCGAPLKAFLRLVAYRDRTTDRRWLEAGLPTVLGGRLGEG